MDYISDLEKEFNSHLASGSMAKFYARPELSENISKLQRGLEIKKQLGNLTFEEDRTLQRVRDVFSNIYKFNSATTQEPSPVLQSNQNFVPLYDLKKSKFVSDSAKHTAPVFFPNLTADQANKIIFQINKQFEEKVLNKLDPNRKQIKPLSERLDRKSTLRNTGRPSGNGRLLEDYMESLKLELPSTAFGDEDSSMDLSKIKLTANK